MEFKGYTIVVEKSPHISGPMQFKPVLFKGRLYWFPHCGLVAKVGVIYLA